MIGGKNFRLEYIPLTHFLLILHKDRYSFVCQWRNIFSTSGATAATKEGLYILVLLKACTASLSCIFTYVLALSSSPDVY